MPGLANVLQAFALVGHRSNQMILEARRLDVAGRKVWSIRDDLHPGVTFGVLRNARCLSEFAFEDNLRGLIITDQVFQVFVDSGGHFRHRAFPDQEWKLPCQKTIKLLSWKLGEYFLSHIMQFSMKTYNLVVVAYTPLSWPFSG